MMLDKSNGWRHVVWDWTSTQPTLRYIADRMPVPRGATILLDCRCEASEFQRLGLGRAYCGLIMPCGYLRGAEGCRHAGGGRRGTNEVPPDAPLIVRRVEG